MQFSEECRRIHLSLEAEGEQVLEAGAGVTRDKLNEI